MFKSIFNYLSRRSSRDDALGPNEIVSALYELSSDVQPTIGILGEPRMVDRGGRFSNHYRVVIPVTIGGDYSVANLEFDLPNGVNDEESEFFDFLKQYDIYEVENLDAVKGGEIDIEWTGGTPVPVW